ncbi:MAG: membrane protein insertion efficiency factor YidD [Ignavibacteriota bacterium]
MSPPGSPRHAAFYPTCSDYMREAVERHGAARGVWMGLRRLGAMPSVSGRRVRSRTVTTGANGIF